MNSTSPSDAILRLAGAVLAVVTLASLVLDAALGWWWSDAAAALLIAAFLLREGFAIWPLSEAAQACFGTPDWPANRTVPQMSLEFEVRDADAVQSAAEELRQRGFTLLHERREEPWGQTVARLQSPEGSIIGISFAPSLHH